VFYQMSASDQRRGRVGTRVHYWVKDLGAMETYTLLDDNDLIVMTDVDEHVDMPTFMARVFKPILLYTFTPRTVACSAGEVSFTSSNGIWTYDVSGGGAYAHQVWNYNHDVIRVSDRWCAAVYHVDIRYCDANHSMILLTPIVRWSLTAYAYRWSQWLSSLEATPLERLNPTTSDGQYNVMRVVTSNGMFVSIGRPGEYLEATISVQQFAEIKIVQQQSRHGIGRAELRHITEDPGVAAMLISYFKHSHPALGPKVVAVDRSVLNYQMDVAKYDPEAKPAVVPFMTPFIAGQCYAPMLCANNDEAMVNGRILKIKPSNRPASNFMNRCMDEFIQHFWGDDLGKMSPTGLDEVYVRQNRPSQRTIIEMGRWVSKPMRIVKSFMKRETYDSVKDPRVIGTINEADKIEYSMFIYPVSDLMKKHPWYAFGVTPCAIANRVVYLCQNAQVMLESDLSRMDGRVSEVVREFEDRLMVAGYTKQFTPRLLELLDSQRHLPGITRFGVRYKNTTNRVSGSAETSCFNSILNALIAYTALRKSGHAANDAWLKLGVYGGDDGLTPDLDPDTFNTVASWFGQVAKAGRTSRGQTGVKFLARIYGPGVWYGDPNSMCDLSRQLSKFHTTVALTDSVSNLTKLYEKASSFYLTDRATPIIGDFVSYVVRAMRGRPHVDIPELHRWDDKFEGDDQYPNELADWMDEYVAKTLPGFDTSAFYRWLELCPPLGALLSPPCFMEVEPVVEGTTVVNGDFISGNCDADFFVRDNITYDDKPPAQYRWVRKD